MCQLCSVVLLPFFCVLRLVFFYSPSTEARGASLCRWAWLMSKGQCFCGLMDALGELHTDTYLSLHCICISCISFEAYQLVGSGLNSMYMHARVFIGIGTILYAAPCKNFRAVLVPGST